MRKHWKFDRKGNHIYSCDFPKCKKQGFNLVLYPMEQESKFLCDYHFLKGKGFWV